MIVCRKNKMFRAIGKEKECN